MSVNNNAILSELTRVANSSAFKSENKNAILSATRETAEEALGKLADCISIAISSSGLSGGAIEAIGHPTTLGVYESGTGFIGYVDMPENFRPSLVPKKYGGINNMAALFNNGYQAGDYVTGLWHGKNVRSLEYRPASDFVEQGVSNFNGNYGSDYNAYAEVSGEF